MPRHIRVFLASPGDVLDEREIAHAVLDDIPYDPLLRGRVTIEEVAWDKKGAGAPILAGLTPQDSIAAGLPRPSDCDIVVVIFWSRMGTPLPPAYVKPDGTRYESGTEWEYHDALASFRQSGSPYVLLYRRTEPVLLDPDQPNFDERADQRRRVRVFFDSLRNEDGSARDGYTAYEKPAEFREKLEHDIKSLLARILTVPNDPRAEESNAPAPELWHGSPFPGLRPFTAADAPIFHGRDREIDSLVARIGEQRFVAVVGASGGGKSSLVAAGVIPRLQLTAGGAGATPWSVVQATPDHLGTGDPFVSIAAALLHAFPTLDRKNLASSLREDSGRLASIMSEHSPSRTLFFVDQFEELFTTIRPALREPFIRSLQTLSGLEPLRTVITLRADFYAQCVEHQVLAQLVERSTFPLPAPSGPALFDMISKPAARAGLTFEEGLAMRILEDTGNEPGALALMAYTLDELYRRSEGGSVLSHAMYEDVGGVQGAIGKRSEAVFATVGEAERDALPRVFSDLVEVDERGTATRHRARLSTVARSPAAAMLVEALTEARLLVASRDESNTPIVEVAHEALFRSWERLADWIKEMADDLRLLRQVRTAAAEWNANGRRDDFLWSHERLAPVYALRETLGVELDEVVMEFIRPEWERLTELIGKDQRFFRQRPHIERLIQIGRPALGAMVECLQYASTLSARNALREAIASFGEEAVDGLLHACDSPWFTAKDVVVITLGKIDSPHVVEALPSLLSARDDGIRTAAAIAIARRRASHLIDTLCDALKREMQYEVARAILHALATFDSDVAFTTLCDSVESERWPVYQCAVEALRNVAQLTQDIDEDDDGQPMAADDEDFTLADLIWANRRVWEKEGRVELAVKALAARLESAGETLFETSMTALLAIDHDSAAAAVGVALERVSEYEFKHIVVPNIGMARDAIGWTLIELLDSPSATVRQRAAETLGIFCGWRIRRKSKPLIAAAAAGLERVSSNDPRSRVRRVARVALNAIEARWRARVLTPFS
jgi:HEAT repeat protein